VTDTATDVPNLGRCLLTAFGRSATHPVEVSKAAWSLAGALAKCGPATVGRGPGVKPDPAESSEWVDGRCADTPWEDNPAFYAIRRAYLATCRFGDDLLAAGSHDPVTDAKAQLAWKLAVDSVAPANFMISNPTALRRAIETAGWSVVAGATNFLSDLLFNGGRPRQVDATRFELGRNLAATPGKVVYRNDLMELIQYAPQTERVHAVPLLASPPWINKYYVMDLAPQRSFLEWAVQHERTVFAISYRNADASMREVTLDDYLLHGPNAALDVIREITGTPTADIVGLCLGGALTAMSAAYLAATDPGRIGTITLLNTLLDYANPGALGVFTDEETVTRLEKQMAKTGFLDAEKMAATFNVLRPNDLIFNYVVSNWLLGEQPKAFDILAWNADSTRMPARMHTSYLRSMYVQNLLALGELDLAGHRLNLADVTSDAYVVGAIKDHIVPWTSSHESTKLLGGDVRYVLSSGGHIAGIVNPPNPKAWYETATKNPEEGAAWRAAAQRYPGTWWEDWAAWAASRAGALTEPPPIGSEVHQPIADAPGEYVQG
jgi:polyhydroxyalkanoate synthase